MKLPKTITAGELADRNNPTARAIWSAVKRGEARVTWENSTIIGMMIDKKYNQLHLKIDENTRIFTPPEMVLVVEALTA